MSSSSHRITHLPPLSSKTTARLLRKQSEPPFPLPLASEKMKSGTRSSFTASPLPPPSLQSSLRLKNTTQAPTSHALPDGSLQMPNVRTKQPLLWSSLRLRCRYNHSERKNHTKFFAEHPPHWSTTISHRLAPSLYPLLQTNHPFLFVFHLPLSTESLPRHL